MSARQPTPRQKVRISLERQRIELLVGETLVMDAPVSTAANGAGERINSECTPRGRHVIRAMIGAGAPMNTVFMGRRPTGEIYTAALGARYPGRDWILTRILWLSGLERGLNRLGDVDTMRRYIYIHGTPDEVALGRPGSHGCVRMSNADVCALFERVAVGTHVTINP